MIYPSNGVVTQGFSSSHPAVDIAFPGGGAVSYGKPIVAPEDGTVAFVGQMGSGVNDAGTVVQIKANNRVHRLCHLIPTSPTVKVGDSVKLGQQVGQMGWSGYVKPANKDGTHLHWVMEINGVRVDGRKYVTEEVNMNPTRPQIARIWLLANFADLAQIDAQTRENIYSFYEQRNLDALLGDLSNGERRKQVVEQFLKGNNPDVLNKASVEDYITKNLK